MTFWLIWPVRSLESRPFRAFSRMLQVFNSTRSGWSSSVVGRIPKDFSCPEGPKICQKVKVLGEHTSEMDMKLIDIFRFKLYIYILYYTWTVNICGWKIWGLNNMMLCDDIEWISIWVKYMDLTRSVGEWHNTCLRDHTSCQCLSFVFCKHEPLIEEESMKPSKSNTPRNWSSKRYFSSVNKPAFQSFGKK